MALNKIQGPSTGPFGYIKAAFQWLNSLLDPIRNVWIRTVGSNNDNHHLKTLDHIETIVISIDERIEDLKFYSDVAKDKKFLNSKTKTQLLHEFNLCKTTISGQREALKRLPKSKQGSYIERKKQEEVDILNDRMEKLTELQVKLGFSTLGRDRIQLTHEAKKFAETLADIVTKVLIPRNIDVMDLSKFNRQSTLPIKNFAAQLSEEIFLPLSNEEIQIVAQTIQDRLIERFKGNRTILNPNQLATSLAISQTERLASELVQIIRQNYNR